MSKKIAHKGWTGAPLGEVSRHLCQSQRRGACTRSGQCSKLRGIYNFQFLMSTTRQKTKLDTRFRSAYKRCRKVVVTVEEAG